MRYFKGFTLSELLIALAVLGVMATFTIPKLLHNNQAANRKAVFKEVISILAQTTVAAVSENLGPQDYASYLVNRLNYSQFCDYPAWSTGCWNPTSDAINYMSANPGWGYVLPSGAVLGLHGVGGPGTRTYTPKMDQNYQVFVDYNGLAGPNKLGEDEILLMMCFDPAGCQGTWWQVDYQKVTPAGPESYALWDEIWSN